MELLVAVAFTIDFCKSFFIEFILILKQVTGPDYSNAGHKTMRAEADQDFSETSVAK